MSAEIEVLVERINGVVTRIEHLRELMDERHRAAVEASQTALVTAQRASNSHRWLITTSIMVLLGLLANLVAILTR